MPSLGNIWIDVILVEETNFLIKEMKLHDPHAMGLFGIGVFFFFFFGLDRKNRNIFGYVVLKKLFKNTYFLEKNDISFSFVP